MDIFCIKLYIGVSEIATYCDFFVSFFGSYFLKFRNALGDEKTAKLVFIFKCMRFIFVNKKLCIQI